MFTNNSYKISHNALKVEPGEWPRTNRRIQINREGTQCTESKLSKHSQTRSYVHTPTFLHMWVCMFTNKNKVGRQHAHTHTSTHAASVVMQRQQQTVAQMHQCYLTAGNATIINLWIFTEHLFICSSTETVETGWLCLCDLGADSGICINLWIYTDCWEDHNQSPPAFY